MHTSVHIDSSNPFQLRNAILLYGNRTEALATLHEVCEAPDGGVPYLGVARTLTTEFVRSMMQQLGGNTVLEVFPENVIARTQDVIAWWSPAQERTMFFRTNDDVVRTVRSRRNRSLTQVSGRRFPTPALLWKVSGHDLYLRALERSERPTSQTPLYRAPFYNTSDEGRVCQGTMPAPQDVSIATIMQWEIAYFASAFTHALGTQKLTSYRGGFVPLWTSLADHRKPFPTQYLVEAKQSVQAFLTEE